MNLISAYTLVDITETKVRRSDNANTPEFHQQQNFNMLLQSIGMRAQPLDYTLTIFKEKSLDDYKFSSNSDNTLHTIWRLRFSIEADNIWQDDAGEFSLLQTDCHAVPIVADLENTVCFPTDIFDTRDAVNLYFEYS